MITMHCTYPDGSTSEARYAMPLELALVTYGASDWPPSNRGQIWALVE